MVTKNYGSGPGAARKILQRGRKVTKHGTERRSVPFNVLVFYHY